MNEVNRTRLTKSMAKILIGPYKNAVVEIIEQVQEGQWPAWNLKLPNGQPGLFFSNEFHIVKVNID